MCRYAAIFVIAVALISSVSCWAQASGQQMNVTGTVTYRERLALPPDAAIDVRLEDTSVQDAPAKLIGESIFAT